MRPEPGNEWGWGALGGSATRRLVSVHIREEVFRLKWKAALRRLDHQYASHVRRDQATRTTPVFRIGPTPNTGFIATGHLGYRLEAAA